MMKSVTDELLFELYMLDRKNIEYHKTNNDYYLLNRSLIKYKFEIGLVAKVPNELLATHSIDDIVDGCANGDEKFVSLANKLIFTPKEMFIMNILFSHFLNTKHNLVSEISFHMIECYRKKASSFRNITLNEITANSYRNIINSLANKMLYLKTNHNFRKRKDKNYGVTDIDLEQDLLTISDSYVASSNNISFKYSLGQFGEIIRKCGRFSSEIVPNDCYYFTLNQSIYNVMACDIARQIFILRYDHGNKKPHPLSATRDCGFNFNFKVYFEKLNGECKKNMVRQAKSFYENLERVLKSLQKNNQIVDYEFTTTYREFVRGKGSTVTVTLFYFG